MVFSPWMTFDNANAEGSDTGFGSANEQRPVLLMSICTHGVLAADGGVLVV